MADRHPMDEAGARRVLEECWPECEVSAERRSGECFVSVGPRAAAHSSLGFPDAIVRLAAAMAPSIALPWSRESSPMTYEQRREFLQALVTEEFSADAVVDALDPSKRAEDDFIHGVYLYDALVYAIPKGAVRRHNEADIRRQLRDAKDRFATLLGMPTV